MGFADNKKNIQHHHTYPFISHVSYLWQTEKMSCCQSPEYTLWFSPVQCWWCRMPSQQNCPMNELHVSPWGVMFKTPWLFLNKPFLVPKWTKLKVNNWSLISFCGSTEQKYSGERNHGPCQSLLCHYSDKWILESRSINDVAIVVVSCVCVCVCGDSLKQAGSRREEVDWVMVAVFTAFQHSRA